MKRIVICLLLLAAMLAGMMSVHAAEAEITIQVIASKSEVRVGETVEYTVLATGFGVVAMQFELRFPEGMSYVPNSGATPANLAQKLGVPAADWTEVSKMFTFYNDIGITFAKGTEILRFSCVAEKAGDWTPELYELLPFDGDFEEFEPKLQVQKVCVTDGEEQTKPSATEPTVPSDVGETEQPSGSDDPSVKPSEPDTTVVTTQPESVPNPKDEQVSVDVVPEPTEQTLSREESEEGTETDLEIVTKPTENQHSEEQTEKKIWPLWVVPLGIGVVICCGITVFILRKKKAS